MKISIKCLALYLCFLMLNLITLNAIEVKNQIESNEKKETSNSEIENKRKLEPYKDIWQKLFHSGRGKACKSDKLAAKLKQKLNAATSRNGFKSKKGKFYWVKEWGYGKAAYFFDFIDDVLLKDVLGEFKKIYKDMFAMSSKDTPKYKDLLDFRKLMGTKDKKLLKKMSKNLKKINKNYEPNIYKVSVNTVQLHTALPKWRWPIDLGKKDFAMSFVKKYDMNGDGRLNPRELILASIEHNRHLFGSGICNHCFEGILDKIDAMFQYLDCDNDGLVGAEDFWRNLPQLKRSTTKYNIFALGKMEGIRTDAINDFILKNNKMTKGALNKTEFRNGILFGIWDRQTNYFKIIDGAERSQKKLRWSDGRTVDRKAFNELKAIKLAGKKKNQRNQQRN